jgi:electron transport complex protein RnfC
MVGHIREKLVLIKKTFSGGISFKPVTGNTDHLPLETLAPPPVVTIPLLQGAGLPLKPAIKTGSHVARGQIIGEPGGGTCAPVHASISGTVTAIDRYPYAEDRNALCVTVENNNLDEFASPIPYDKPWHESEPAELLEKVRLSGIVDRAGGYLPLHARLAPAVQKPVQTLILNAVQSEPYLSAGARLFIEQAENVLLGAAICGKIAGAAACRIIISDGKPELAQAISALLSDERFKTFSLEMLKKPKYPAHNERLLVKLCTGREISAAQSGLQAGCVVISPEAAAQVKEAIVDLTPSSQVSVTVSGPAAASPKNLLVRIGTPVRQILEACSVNVSALHKMVSGGMLAGTALQELDAPVIKTTAALLALSGTADCAETLACISCRRCYAVCPVRLEPARLVALIQSSAVAEIRKTPVLECIECGCCGHVCPSKINLVQYLQFGKRLVRSERPENFLLQRPAV